MSYTDHHIAGPREAFDLARQEATIGRDLAKSSAPNLKEQYGQAAYGSTQIAQKLGINPQEPIEVPEQKPQQQIDAQAFNVQAQCSGAFLQECHVGPKADSFFSVACTEISDDIQGIANSLRGGQAAMDPRNITLQQELQMTPAMRPSMSMWS